MIYLIWAEDLNHGIGVGGKMPWNLPDDKEHFYKNTLDSVVVMGRKTFVSLGSKPLTNRLNFIISSNENLKLGSEVKVIRYPQDAIEFAEKQKKNLFVIGGKEVYESFMPWADVLLVTKINGVFEVDTFAPKIDLDIFYLDLNIKHKQDSKHLYAFDFQTYKRKVK